MYIWKRVYNPWVMGGSPHRNIKTEIDEKDFLVADIGKGFSGVVVEHNGKTGVYELRSGGLIGDTLEAVMADVAACDDVDFMRRQCEDAKIEGESADEVSNEKFFAY